MDTKRKMSKWTEYYYHHHHHQVVQIYNYQFDTRIGILILAMLL